MLSWVFLGISWTTTQPIQPPNQGDTDRWSLATLLRRMRLMNSSIYNPPSSTGHTVACDAHITQLRSLVAETLETRTSMALLVFSANVRHCRRTCASIVIIRVTQFKYVSRHVSDGGWHTVTYLLYSCWLGGPGTLGSVSLRFVQSSPSQPSYPSAMHAYLSWICCNMGASFAEHVLCMSLF